MEHQESLQSNESLVKWVKGYHLAEQKPNKTEFSLSHSVTQNLELVVCSLLTITGPMNATVLVECGTKLGDTILNEFFFVKKYFEVRDTNDKFHFYRFDDSVTCDINVTITDQCNTFTEERCMGTEGICKWSNGRCAREFIQKKSHLGLIVGASVGGVVLLAIIIIVVIALLTKKKKRQKNGIELANTVLFKTMNETKNVVTVKMDGKDTVLELVEEVGHGSFATVWKAVDGDSKKVFAVKVVDGRRSVGATEAQKEAMMMEQLDTQFVVAVFGCGFTQNTMAIAMEFFPLGSLQNVLQQDKLPSNARVPMLLDIAKAMAYLHTNGIIHRDLKPGNVLVCSIDPNLHPMSKFVSFFHQQQESEWRE